MSKLVLLQGALDMLIRRVLARRDARLGHGRPGSQLSRNTLQLDEGLGYPSLYRMKAKGWIKGRAGAVANNRNARYYSLTKAGRKAARGREKNWNRLSAMIAEVTDLLGSRGFRRSRRDQPGTLHTERYW